MGLGMIGAIGGVGEGLQTQGSYWAEEKKQARIEEMKIAAEGRAEKRGLEAEGRQEKSRLDAEGRQEKSKLDAEGRANAEFNRREGSKQASSRSQSDYERAQELEDDKARQKAGLLNTNQSRPRSEFEGSNAYEAYRKNEEDKGREAKSYPEFLKERTGGMLNNRELNSQNGNNNGKGEKSLEIPKDLAEAKIDVRRFSTLKRYLDQGNTPEDAREVWRNQGKPEWIIDRMFEVLGVE